jgi:serine protease Do
MKKLLRGSCRLTVAAAALGIVLADVSPAAAQGGFDILTLRAPGSTIGVEITELDAEKVKASGVENGVVINNVRPNTPASRAGFQAGDIVVEFDGEAVRSARQFRRLVEETRPGREVKATVVRDRNRQALTVTPELGTAGNIPELTPFARPAPNARPAEPFRIEPALPRLAPFNNQGRLGVTVMPLESQLAEYFGARQGVLVTAVGADTPASRAGLKAGDVIVEVGSRPVTSAADVTEAMRSSGSGGSLDVKVLRDKKEMVLKVAIPADTPPAPERQRL